MVGVPGKYQGCNTCRLRRVKCDNERPFCRKCLNTGRECGGYARETVFIIGTIEDGGRCSSHPPRVVKNSKKSKAGGSSSKAGSRSASTSSGGEDDEKLELVAEQPLQPAWNDLITVSHQGRTYQVQLAALQTRLANVVRGRVDVDEGFGGQSPGLEAGPGEFSLASFAMYEPVDPKPMFADEDFNLKTRCLVHLSEKGESQDATGRARTESICLFLYEHNNSVMFSDQPWWKDPNIQNNPIRRLGPQNFCAFPNHHFFVRVYRYNAICTALLNRKPIFLEEPAWITTPWEQHPKSSLDYLFDYLATLPRVFHRADRIFATDPTLSRRLLAQDLLSNCLHVESQLDTWYATTMHEASSSNSSSSSASTANIPPYWIDTNASHAQIPFADPFAFSSPSLCLALIHYWASLVLLHPAVESLHAHVLERVVDAWGPATYPNLPPRLAEPDFAPRYGAKEVRELAANVCRSLDFALQRTAQPDLLAVPLYVVGEFYGAISASGGDGQLELMWCEAFRARLVERGAWMGSVVAGRGWRELVKF